MDDFLEKHFERMLFLSGLFIGILAGMAIGVQWL